MLVIKDDFIYIPDLTATIVILTYSDTLLTDISCYTVGFGDFFILDISWYFVVFHDIFS